MNGRDSGGDDVLGSSLSLDNARLYEELARKIEELVETREQLVQAEKLLRRNDGNLSVGGNSDQGVLFRIDLPRGK